MPRLTGLLIFTEFVTFNFIYFVMTLLPLRVFPKVCAHIIKFVSFEMY